ncbi:MAG: HIT family protein [Deltaproteobacteria bacterium]|nr:HIT family protein [Deltaproteobacteria bacterium]
MPTLIPRDQALARIVAEGGRPPCLMCAILDEKVGATYKVAEDEHCLVMLPRYVRTWGHVMVVPRAHVTRFSELSATLWAHVNQLTLRAAKMVESLRAPKRVYISSTGSATSELIQTSRHIHVHVLPVYYEEDRPADLFSWSPGVYVAEHDEWVELRDSFTQWWTQDALTAR